MGFLKKLGLVEEEDQIIPVTTESAQDVAAEVDVEINSSVNVVDEIYMQNGLSDKSNSIYMVQSLIDTLPDEMTTAKKQSTVSGILMVSGKSVENLLSDAADRIETLCAAKDQIVGDRTDEIMVANSDIEELKKAIEVATIKIKEAEDIIAATKQSVDEEVGVINNLVKFCEGMNNK